MSIIDNWSSIEVLALANAVPGDFQEKDVKTSNMIMNVNGKIRFLPFFIFISLTLLFYVIYWD